MSRLSPELQLAVSAPHVTPFALVEIEYDPEPVRLTSLPYDIEVFGATWYGVAMLGDISEIQEGPENRSYGTQLTLAGIPLEFCEYLLRANLKGRVVRLYLGFLDEQGRVIGSPYPTFTGISDTVDLKVGQDAAVQISVESLLVQWERPKTRRFTSSDQRRYYPADAGLDFVAAMTSRELAWGRDQPPPTARENAPLPA